MASEAAKILEKVASGKGKAEGVAERKTRITDTICAQRLSTSQTVGPVGQEEVAEVITTILSDDFEVPSEGSTIIVSTV